MFHIFKYRFICFVKNKTILFWTLAFPICLSTLFYFAFSNLDSEDDFNKISVAVVDNGNENFNTFVDDLSDDTLDPDFTTQQKAEELLESGDVSAILISDSEPTILFIDETIEVQILKEMVLSYLSVDQTVSNLATSPDIANDILENKVYVNDVESKAFESSSTSQYFFTVIAMTILFGAFLGVKSIEDAQANQSSKAVRISVAPTHKIKVILIDFMVSFVIMFSVILIVLFYFMQVLDVDFGNNFTLVLLVNITAIVMSLGLGILVGTASRLSNIVNNNLVAAFSMASCFLAGMMVASIPYLIDSKLPFVKYINPASLITNSFNIIYYYNDVSAVYINVALMGLIGLGALFISYILLRRKSYEYI